MVGFGAALIMLVSKYGFMNVLVNNRVVLDPSRVAAQIVTGIGFIGAGLPILALAVTAGHIVIVFAFPYIASRLPKSRWTPSLLQISYHDGRLPSSHPSWRTSTAWSPSMLGMSTL